MSSYNRIIIVGNLGRDPETRYTPAGDPICSFSVATSEKRKDGGEVKEETTWHNVQAFGRTAEVASEYLKKGGKCLVEGRVRQRRWTDKDGNERTTYEVVCDRLVLLGSARSDAEVPTAAQATTRAPAPAAASKPKPAGGIADMDDDIPF